MLVNGIGDLDLSIEQSIDREPLLYGANVKIQYVPLTRFSKNISLI
jgi:hypothetical protein